MNKDRFIAFVYCLVRDCVPAGEITKITEWLRPGDSFQLTNEHLAAFATDICDRLRGENKLESYD